MIQIDQALISAFIAGNFGVSIAHENMDYTPTAPYAEIIVQPNDRTPYSLAHTDETDGVFRVLLNYPAGSGAVAAKTKADEILAHFKIGQRFAYDNLTVNITRNQRQPGAQIDGWYRLDLAISYRAFLMR